METKRYGGLVARRLEDGLIGELLRHRPQVGPLLAELLDHADEDEVLDRVDPEPGAGRAAPPVLTLGVAAGLDRVEGDREVETEAGAGSHLGDRRAASGSTPSA